MEKKTHEPSQTRNVTNNQLPVPDDGVGSSREEDKQPIILYFAYLAVAALA